MLTNGYLHIKISKCAYVGRYFKAARCFMAIEVPAVYNMCHAVSAGYLVICTHVNIWTGGEINANI